MPAAKGIVAVATEVVCKITFSPMLNPEVIPYRSRTRKTPNPSTADCKHREGKGEAADKPRLWEALLL